jgi:RNA polymerase sigma-70 factor (ECF subfamily)
LSGEAHAPQAVTVQTEASGFDVTKFVEREAGGLLGYFVRRTSSPEDAADLLSDALVVIWRRKADVPTDETKARMWMFGVARKVLSGHRRGYRRRTALSARLRAQVADIPVLTEHYRNPARDIVRELVAEMPEIDREVIRLAYWEGFSLAEIAGIMSMRPGTIRSRHARAISKLRIAMGDTLPEN